MFDDAPAQNSVKYARWLTPVGAAVFEGPDTFSLCAVDPIALPDAVDARPKLDGFPIIRQLPVHSAGLQRLLLDAFITAAEAGSERRHCFNPRHALRATRADLAIDVLLCFQCGTYEVLRSGIPVLSGWLAQSVPAIFREVLE